MLQNYPRLWATNGATVGAAASTYTWVNSGGANTLLSSVGVGSLIELTNVTSFQVGYSSGQPVYSVNARSNGVIDLRNVGQITGPSDDDWLDFNVNSGGNILFNNLRRVSGRIRFNFDLPSYSFAALERATDTYFTVGQSNVLLLPQLLSVTTGGFTVGTGAVVRATNLLALDNVSLTLNSDGTFAATNLTSYRNSDITYAPSRQMLLGSLTDLYASRLSVSGAATGRVFAVSYDTAADWRSSPTLFSADGAGALLDLSAMASLRVRYGAFGAYTYSDTANNGNVIDWSGLQSILGPAESDDWFRLTITNGGNIQLPNLTTTDRGVWFNIQAPDFELPALTRGAGRGSRLRTAPA